MLDDAESVVSRVAEVLGNLQIPYLVGGSFASSLFGIPRFTQDVDFAADIALKQVPALVAALEQDFYVDAGMIQDAIIHLATMYKADIFLPKIDSWAAEEMARRRLERLGEDAASIYFASPEDVILS